VNERALISRSGGFHPARLGLYVLLSLAAALSLAVFGFAQSPPEDAPVPAPTYKFLSGSVVEIYEDSMVVRRSALGRTLEVRRFRINAETKVEGDLKLKARVTVGYTSGENGDVAARVIVRTPARRRTSSGSGAIGRNSASRVVS
jgi:hypothetical protein